MFIDSIFISIATDKKKMFLSLSLLQMDFSFLCSLDAKIHSISQILQTIKIF